MPDLTTARGRERRERLRGGGDVEVARRTAPSHAD
jgi:hypothetical protein